MNSHLQDMQLAFMNKASLVYNRVRYLQAEPKNTLGPFCSSLEILDPKFLFFSSSITIDFGVISFVFFLPYPKPLHKGC